MFLFINTISDPAIYILFHSGRIKKQYQYSLLKGQEKENFLLSVEEFLTQNTLTFTDLEGIVVINGPGSFTGMRIVTLTINTLAFIHGTPLYSLDFFTLLSYSGLSYPMCVKANRGEYLIKNSGEDVPSIVPITDMLLGQYSGLGDINDFANKKISIQSEIQYAFAIQKLVLNSPTNKIDPFYIKKPNIT